MKYYKIDSGKITEVTKKNISEKDYFIEYGDEFTIIDGDRRKIRPLVADMLNKINIETLQTRLLKLLVTFSFVNIFIFLIVLFLSFSNSGNVKNLINEFENIEQIKIKQNIIEGQEIKTGTGGVF